jgi:Fe-S-cluster containining protein
VTRLTDALCLQCGLCCNGVLFADVRPEPGDRSPLFAGRSRVNQPCPAFNAGDRTCAVYARRPARCRRFECRQWIGVEEGNLSVAAALKNIRVAHRLADRVGTLLAELGHHDVKLPLGRRFKRCQRNAENGGLPPEQFATLADLQLAMHELTLLLAREFYV